MYDKEQGASSGLYVLSVILTALLLVVLPMCCAIQLYAVAQTQKQAEYCVVFEDYSTVCFDSAVKKAGYLTRYRQ